MAKSDCAEGEHKICNIYVNYKYKYVDKYVNIPIHLSRRTNEVR